MTINARQLYEAGSLKDAIEAAKGEVRSRPTDTSIRGFLCELLCLTNELERADGHLDALVEQDPQATVGIQLFRQLIRAEQARQQFYTDGRVPEFLNVPSPVLQMHLEASILLREGKVAEATQKLAAAEEQRTKVSGTCDEQPFTDFRDLDDLTAPFFEVLTSTGKYYWVPIEHVDLIEFRAPSRPRDLLWQRAHMIVRNGPDGEVYLPTLYFGTAAETDDRVRLGRVTDWRGGEGTPVRGIGQRTFLIGEDSKSILELKELAFAQPSA
jgi:type VI secretion system protein ImpE